MNEVEIHNKWLDRNHRIRKQRLLKYLSDIRKEYDQNGLPDIVVQAMKNFRQDIKNAIKLQCDFTVTNELEVDYALDNMEEIDIIKFVYYRKRRHGYG